MAKRKHWSQRTPREKLVVLFQDLAVVVERFEKLYTEHPELEKEVDIADLIAGPFGEWIGAIDTFLDEEYRQAQD
jgi:hypothetical protein